jgi:hypothetical protein
MSIKKNGQNIITGCANANICLVLTQLAMKTFVGLVCDEIVSKLAQPADAKRFQKTNKEPI